MTIRVYNNVVKVARLILTIGLLCCASMLTTAQAEQYTAEKPLVIVCNWDFPPFEYNDTYGNPSGFNIDVLHAILDNLKVPHRFITKEWSQATKLFESQEADIILDPVARYQDKPYYISNSILSFYRIRVATRTGKPTIKSVEQLKNVKEIMLKKNDVSSAKVIKELAPEMQVEYYSVKEALGNLVNGRKQYFLWGERPLRWKIKELGLEEQIQINEIDFPAGEVHITGYDEQLIHQIDDAFARMEQNGDLEEIRVKWFYPEKADNDASPIVLYITLCIILLGLGFYLLNILIIKRVRRATSKGKEAEEMMRLALSIGSFSVTIYDVKQDRFTNVHGNMLPEKRVTLAEFIDRVHPDDKENIRQELERLKTGKNGICVLNKRWNMGTKEQPDWQYIHGNAIAEKDDKGNTQYIVNIVNNVTKEFEQERLDSEMATKYFKIFDCTHIAMAFYDKDGVLGDYNKKMAEFCNITKDKDSIFSRTRLTDWFSLNKDFDPNSREQFHVCHHMYYPKEGLDKFIEFRVIPVYEGDELQYYLVTLADMTEEREMYLELNRHEKELRKANDVVNKYEQEMYFMLENSQMWIWRSNLKERQIKFMRSLKKEEYTINFDEYAESLFDEDREKFLKGLESKKTLDASQNYSVHFKYTPIKKEPHWGFVSSIPTYDENGEQTGHFGIIRDITRLMEAQEKLKIETARAENSGKLKSVFLANMTHEIRTPLNAIMGFSDLLQVIDNPTERHEFIRIIRNNCDMLMRLINDIIEASTINQSPIVIDSEEVDFAAAFNDICQSLAQRVQEPGVEFIVDNPYQTFKTSLDKGRMQQVITNFVTNAVKYTHQGHIKVGYRIEDNQRSDNGEQSQGIYMYCEDTGAGIPADKQKAVFERFVKLNDFVQGTGLGLSICKNIADRCGGRIGVESEGEGKGSTFWIWIPCKDMNGKKETT